MLATAPVQVDLQAAMKNSMGTEEGPIDWGSPKRRVVTTRTVMEGHATMLDIRAMLVVLSCDGGGTVRDAACLVF